MAEQATAPRVEDLVSVGSRISWGAILAGAVMALAIYFLLAALGAAVGVAVSERVSASKLHTAAIAWAIVTLCVALFTGGIVTSQFTIGENRMEAVLYGIVMWGTLLGLLLGLGAAGMRGGFTALVAMTELPLGSLHLSSAEQQELADAAARISWYVFGGAWLSMFAAAAGAWLGAGPVFRVVVVNPVAVGRIHHA